MRFAIVVMMLSLLAASGCATWRNPNLVDQSKADELLERDEDYCHKVAEQMDPIQPGNQLPGPRGDLLDDVSTYGTEFDQRTNQYSSFEHCMRARGWVKN